jgi:dolichol-phosphate mannosyltransferase
MQTLSVVVPVLNERGNIAVLVERLESVLAEVDWELIFVDDDSPDGTADACRQLSYAHPRVRVLQRIGRIGLASACVEGMLASSAPYLAVMDGDLQHDETVLPEMLRLAQTKNLDLVVASRNITGGSMGEFSKERVRLSNFGRYLSRWITNCELSDPMSGFFLIKRPFLNEVVHDLSQIGFKILLDLIASCHRRVHFIEVPYTFHKRGYGNSKLDTTVSLEFLLLLADKLVGDFLPVRYVLYSLVGLSGIVVNMVALAGLHLLGKQPVVEAQVIATSLTIVWNFFFNNWLTYRDRKLKGRWSILKGLLVYAAGCSLGASVNVRFTAALLNMGLEWFVAGFVGTMVSSVWNYGIASVFTWKLLRRRQAFAGAVWRSRQVEQLRS